ncbi:hypothetical protein MNBD_BACTEROID03-1347 [hydrothermal vent metagenome]|uniref:Uncharacterized protein n=1 Tax=hydrothermal vent metagenome TaxID=652676 RepID=A0A3B0T7Q0_9ZZZZ
MKQKLLYATFFFFLMVQAVAIAQIPAKEKSALIDLHAATKGGSWNIKWDLKAPAQQWYGVDIKDGHVVGIGLYDNNLKGNIPASIKNLTKLEVLDLAFNSLGAELPEELTKLSHLKVLKLEMNNLKGKLPANLTSMVNLEELILFNNQLEGNIPESIGSISKLKILNLSSNFLTGNLPESMGNLVNLTSLGLFGNKLEGEISFSFGKMKNLSELILAFNDFDGAAPEGIQSLKDLQFVQLQGNDFNSFDNLQDMQSIDLVAFDTDNLQLDLKYRELHEIDTRMAETKFEDDVDN